MSVSVEKGEGPSPVDSACRSKAHDLWEKATSSSDRNDTVFSNCRTNATPFWIPKMDMTFTGFDEAWDFWVTYGGLMVFDVRKCHTNTSDLDGLVCANQGSGAENKKFSIVKRN